MQLNLPSGVYFYQLKAGDFIEYEEDDFAEIKGPPLNPLPKGGEKRKVKNIFLITQTPVNIDWQGFSFANYKSILFDFHKN